MDPLTGNKDVKGVLKSINYSDPIVRYRGRKVVRLASLLSETKDINIDLAMAVDIFYSFYLPYPLLIESRDIPRDKELNYKIVSSMLSSDRVHNIRSKTVADNLLSSIAAGVFITELQRTLGGQGDRSEGSRERGSSGRKSYGILDSEVNESVKRAMTVVERDIDNAKKLRSLIEGDQPGNVSVMAYEEYAPELVKLARNTEVKKILDMIAGVKPWRINIPRRKTRFKHGEILGYELGNDIERIVASNLALPDEFFYLRYLEKKLLLYQKVLTQSHGPLYVLLDKCLPGDTEILLPDGSYKQLKDIRVGEIVVSCSLDNSRPGSLGRSIYSNVIAMHYNGVKILYKVVAGNKAFYATPNHRIPVVRGSNIVELRIDQLRKGDKLVYVESPGKFSLKSVEKISIEGEDKVYDITLENYHFYIAEGFVVHNSGSMDGLKMVWAKAVALSLYMRALKEHREYYFRFFDSIPYSLSRINRRPKARQVLRLIEYIARVKGSGGTDISRAIITACTDVARGLVRNTSDLVLITDGVDRIAEQLVKVNLKKANARLITVMVLGDNRSLKRISTKYFTVTRLGRDDILRVIEV